jgi:hypothetical protein
MLALQPYLQRLHCDALLLLLLQQALASQAVPGPGGVGRVLVEELPGLDGRALQEAAVSLLGQLGEPAAVLLASRGEGDAAGKVSFVAAISPQVSSSWQLAAAAYWQQHCCGRHRRCIMSRMSRS